MRLAFIIARARRARSMARRTERKTIPDAIETFLPESGDQNVLSILLRSLVWLASILERLLLLYPSRLSLIAPGSPAGIPNPYTGIGC